MPALAALGHPSEIYESPNLAVIEKPKGTSRPSVFSGKPCTCSGKFPIHPFSFPPLRTFHNNTNLGVGATPSARTCGHMANPSETLQSTELFLALASAAPMTTARRTVGCNGKHTVNDLAIARLQLNPPRH